MNQRAGRIQVGGEDHEVTFERGGNQVASAIDAAYEEKIQGQLSRADRAGRRADVGNRADLAALSGCPNLPYLN
jgi:hypothetical protein